MLKYIAKRYKWKYGIKYATYCFFLFKYNIYICSQNRTILEVYNL